MRDTKFAGADFAPKCQRAYEDMLVAADGVDEAWPELIDRMRVFKQQLKRYEAARNEVHRRYLRELARRRAKSGRTVTSWW